MSGWQIKKLSYSAGPWRIVDASGREVAIESKLYKFQRGNEVHPLYGYDTKTDAVAALGRFAERMYDALVETSTRLATLEAKTAQVSASIADASKALP